MVQPSNLRFISEAALAANQSAQDTTLVDHESRLDGLEVLGGLAPGDTSDATVKALLTNPATDTAKAIYSGIPVSAGNAPYSADPTGVVDATSALNAAEAARAAKGIHARLFIPAGKYKISGTVSFAGGLDASQATFEYYGTGTAVVLGSDASGVSTPRQNMQAPRVINKSRPASGWDGTSVGIKAVNLNTCEVYIPFVQNFENGLLLYGFGGGMAYSTFRLGALWNNHTNQAFDNDTLGYTNQNVFVGGRLHQDTTNGATFEDVNAYQVRMVPAGGGTGAGNNLWLNTSFEGVGVAYYVVDNAGRYNQFINCRWEVPGTGVTPRVRWRSTSQYNKIRGGYDAEKIVETIDAGAIGNVIEDGIGSYMKASTTAGQVIPHNVWTPVNTWTTSALRRITYDAATGNFTPRAGRWRINATITVAPGATLSYSRARLLIGGASVDIAEAHGGALRQTLKLSATETFTGTSAFVVQVLQAQTTGTAGQALEATSPYVTISAEYLGI